MKWSLVLAGVVFFVLPLLPENQVQSQSIITYEPPLFKTKGWPKQMSVLSYNTFGMWYGPIHVGKHWPDRLPRVVQAVREVDADVVLLQELWRKKDRRYIMDSLQAQYPYKIASSWDKNSIAAMGLKGFVGGGLLVLSKYPFFAPAQFHSYKEFTAPEEYFAGKGLQVVSVSIEGRLFAFAHTHLGSSHFDFDINDFKPNQITRHMRQIEEMGEQLAEARHYYQERGLNPHFILAGDFNCPEHFWNAAQNIYEFDRASYCYPSLDSTGELIDTYRLLHFEDLGWTSVGDNPYHTVGEPGARLDYIFSEANPRVIPYSSEVVFKDTQPSPPWALSDHFGVLTRFLLL